MLFVAGSEFDDDNIIYSHEIGSKMSEFRKVAKLAEEENLIDFDEAIIDLLRELIEANTLFFDGMTVAVFGAPDVGGDSELLYEFDGASAFEDDKTIGNEKLAFEILEEYNRYPLQKYEEKYLAKIDKQKGKFEEVSVNLQGDAIELLFIGKKDLMFIVFTRSSTLMDDKETPYDPLFYPYLANIAHWTAETFDLPSDVKPTLGENKELFFFILQLLEEYYLDKPKAKKLLEVFRLNDFQSYCVTVTDGVVLLTVEHDAKKKKEYASYGITISPRAVVLSKAGEIVGDFEMTPEFKNKIDMLKNTLK